MYKLTNDQKIANWKEQIDNIDKKVSNLMELKKNLEAKVSKLSKSSTGMDAFDKAINALNQ